MKLLISFSVLIFGVAFGYIPYLWGDTSFFSGWSILLSAVGGIVGVVVGVAAARRWL